MYLKNSSDFEIDIIFLYFLFLTFWELLRKESLRIYTLTLLRNS